MPYRCSALELRYLNPWLHFICIEFSTKHESAAEIWRDSFTNILTNFSYFLVIFDLPMRLRSLKYFHTKSIYGVNICINSSRTNLRTELSKTRVRDIYNIPEQRGLIFWHFMVTRFLIVFCHGLPISNRCYSSIILLFLFSRRKLSFHNHTTPLLKCKRHRKYLGIYTLIIILQS